MPRDDILDTYQPVSRRTSFEPFVLAESDLSIDMVAVAVVAVALAELAGVEDGVVVVSGLLVRESRSQSVAYVLL